MKYAVLFANHSWSGASGIIAIKDTLDEAIVVATKEVNDVMKKNDIDMTIDECIAEEKLEYAEKEDLITFNLVRSWMFPELNMEVYIQELNNV